MLQHNITAFLADSAIPIAAYGHGSPASYDPSLDGGALGDVLNIVSRQVVSALLAGCRTRSPHVPTSAKPWRYAAVLAQAKLCQASDGWACLFEDALPSEPGRDQVLIDWKRFSASVKRHGIRDPVLVQRLFAEFMEKEPPEPTRLDYREFLRACSGMDDAPINRRVSELVRRAHELHVPQQAAREARGTRWRQAAASGTRTISGSGPGGGAVGP